MDKYTYLIFGRKGFYKIGHSINPEKRLKQLNTANPDARLVCYGKGMTEKKLHNKFKKKRTKGEWFKLNTKDVRFIIKNIDNEYEGVKPVPKFIQFGKYHSTRLQDMNSPDQIQYMKWFINNATTNTEWIKPFENQLRRCNAL